MKKYFVAIFLLVVFLAVFIPLASTNPDGLEKTVETFGVQETGVIWKGLFGDYTIPSIGNQYLSTLLAGIIGTIMVLLCAIAFGKLALKKHVENHKVA